MPIEVYDKVPGYSCLVINNINLFQGLESISINMAIIEREENEIKTFLNNFITE